MYMQKHTYVLTPYMMQECYVYVTELVTNYLMVMLKELKICIVHNYIVYEGEHFHGSHLIQPDIYIYIMYIHSWYSANGFAAS